MFKDKSHSAAAATNPKVATSGIRLAVTAAAAALALATTAIINPSAAATGPISHP
jgi:hypothetical protein